MSTPAKNTALPVEESSTNAPLANDVGSTAEHSEITTKAAMDELSWIDEEVEFTCFQNESDKHISSKKCLRSTWRAFFNKFLEPEPRPEKTGKCFVGAKFFPNTERKNEFVESVTVLSLDFDNKTKGQKSDSLTSAADLRVWLMGRGYAGYIHETFSSTPEHPKFRLILPLERPFIIRTSIADANDNEKSYTRAYEFVGNDTGEKFDPACKNVSRPFFTPAYNPSVRDSCNGEFIPGRRLDLYKIVAELPPEPKRRSARQNCGPVTEERRQFNKVWDAVRPHLQLAALALDVDDTVKGDEDKKTEGFCPFDDDHGTPDGEDSRKTPVVYFNAEKDGKPATAECQHTSCKEPPRPASDFVFALFKSRGVPLDEFFGPYVSEVGSVTLERALALRPPTDEELSDLFKQMRTAQVEAHDGNREQARKIQTKIQKRLAACIPGSDLEERIESLAAIIGQRAAKIAKTIRDDRKVLLDQKVPRERSAGHVDVPSDPSSAQSIWAHWPHNDQVRVATASLLALNDNNPRLFRRTDGKVVRIHKAANDVTLQEVNERAQWAVELSRVFTFQRSEDEGLAPFPDLVSHFVGSNELELPFVEKVSRVPVFASDGSLITKNGYHLAGRIYLHATEEFLPVPDVVTEEHVEEAKRSFNQALQDFPFSDCFDGHDPQPVRHDQNDKASTNWDRGVSSRAHATAMLLQPFVQAMIDGPAPLHFVVKSEPGTGAGYLVNVGGFMLYGNEMPSKVVPTNEEELHKVITATLRGGSSTVFLDNLNHELSSAALASALTSGVWEGRVLGQSTEIKEKIKVTWMLAANNGVLSEELMRRVAPIRLDAALPNPAKARSPDYYNIADLPEWCRSHRMQLVWAAHVLIRNYVQAKAAGELNSVSIPQLPSFPGWSEVMGGILRCAQIEGFLKNCEAYRASNTADEDDGMASYIAHLWEVTDGRPFDMGDALAATRPIMGGDAADPRFGFDFKGRPDDENAQRQQLGRKLTQSKGRTFTLLDGRCVQLKKFRSRLGAKYQIVVVN